MKKKALPDLRPMREKSLEELEGFTGEPPEKGSYLVETIYALRRKPIGEFSHEDLRITIGQNRGIPYLLPIALEKLESEPLAHGHMYRGDLLMSVLRAELHWGAQPETRDRVRRIVEQALELLATVEPLDPWSALVPDPDDLDENDRNSLEPRLREALALLR